MSPSSIVSSQTGRQDGACMIYKNTNLYLTINHLLSLDNLKPQYSTRYLICPHLFENYKLVLRSFYMFTMFFFVYCRENSAHKLTLTILFLLTRYLVLIFSLTVFCPKTQLHHSHRLCYVNHKCAKHLDISVASN